MSILPLTTHDEATPFVRLTGLRLFRIERLTRAMATAAAAALSISRGTTVRF